MNGRDAVQAAWLQKTGTPKSVKRRASIRRMIGMTVNSVVAANVRRLRKNRNISVSELSRRSGVAKATLSTLETGDGNPTVQTLTQLAEALGVLLGDLLEDQAANLIRGTELPVIEDDATRGVVLPRLRSDSIDMYDITFRVGRRHHSQLHSAGALERIYVVDGAIDVETSGEAHTLETGDMIQYDLSEGAFITARGKDARVMLVMAFAQPGFGAVRGTNRANHLPAPDPATK